MRGQGRLFVRYLAVVGDRQKNDTDARSTTKRCKTFRLNVGLASRSVCLADAPGAAVPRSPPSKRNQLRL